MVEIEIDGKKLTAREGQMVIDVADDNDIYIPRFCYHKKLSVAANCRMCLVDIEKAPKPMPACATPVTAGMIVQTKSKKALDAQRAVMEFLLINHPLDCPICDQGGECELQDLAMGYGEDISRYTEGKRTVFDEDLGSLISTDMTRCIHCTRCVRFGTEVAGIRELGATDRGENMRIGTYVKHAMESEISGNIIDLCPVGALTSKPYRFKARAWEMHQHSSIAPHDCVGTNIFIHTRSREYTSHRDVLRVVPKDNEAINETWISDRDRFSYEALSHEDKLSSPLLKKDGTWVPIDWSKALNIVVDSLWKIKDEKGENSIAGLISSSATIEEQYLFQKMLRELGSNNIDHRIKQLDFSQQERMPLSPRFELPIEEIHEQQAVLLVGSDVRREQPIINLKIRRAFLEGAEISCVNTVDYNFNYDLANKKITTDIEKTLENILNASGDDVEKNIAKSLSAQENSVIFIGAWALNHPHAHNIQALCEKVAEKTSSKIAVLTNGANAAGAWLAGCVPHRGPAGENISKPGDHVQSMFENQKSAYLLFNVEPEYDCANSSTALAALKNADLVVSFSPFRGGKQEDYADLILPITSFAETGGTYVNCESRWQRFKAVGPAYEDARPGWKVLRVLGNIFEFPGFEYVCSNEIADELEEKINASSPNIESKLNTSNNYFETKGLQAIVEWQMYSIDSICRRSEPLQKSAAASRACFSLSTKMAEKLKINDGDNLTVTQGDQNLTLPVSIDERLLDEIVLIPYGLKETAGFGRSFSACEIKVG